MEVFILDTNALAALQKADRPAEFGPAWRLIAKKALSGEVCIPREVFEEFTNAPYQAWIREQPELLLESSTRHQKCLVELARDYPAFNDPNKTGIDADQPLVAYAMEINLGVTDNYRSGPARIVTNERHKTDLEPRWRIPDTCDDLGIKYVGLFDMFASFKAFTEDPTS